MYDDYYYDPPQPGSGNAMATAAMVLGILSIVTFSVFYVALPCGAIAIICAILSRSSHAMPGKSRAGMICGIAGAVFSLLITIYSFTYVMTSVEGRAYLEYFYQQYTGDFDFDLDETLQQIFPFLNHSETDGSSQQSGANEAADSSQGTGNDGSVAARAIPAMLRIEEANLYNG